MKYRCKSCVDKRVVEAFQITERTFSDPLPNPEHVLGITYDTGSFLAKYKEHGAITIGRLGDWIIIEENGDVAIYRAAYFAKNFEKEVEKP